MSHHWNPKIHKRTNSKELKKNMRDWLYLLGTKIEPCILQNYNAALLKLEEMKKKINLQKKIKNPYLWVYIIHGICMAPHTPSTEAIDVSIDSANGIQGARHII